MKTFRKLVGHRRWRARSPLTWVRSLPGSQRLRALIAFDEVYGFLPPHPKNPPTKAPMVALLKQARAFGVGVLVATQNPMDLDNRALSNAGLWCIGRLQTDADRARIVDGLKTAWHDRGDSPDLNGVIQRLAPRWFVMRDAHSRMAVCYCNHCGRCRICGGR